MEVNANPSVLDPTVDVLDACHQLVVGLLCEVFLVHLLYADEADACGCKSQAICPEAPAGMVADIAQSLASDCEHIVEGEPVAL